LIDLLHRDTGGVFMVDCMNVAASAVATVKIVPSMSWHRRRFRVLASLPVIGALALSPALAQDFTVKSGDIVGQQILNNIGGIGVIEVGGVVSTDGALAVQMLSANQILDNSGRIETTGLVGVGITSTGPTATITNSGVISTTGQFGVGIYSSGAAATITNRGNISTMGFSAPGIISAGPTATITNFGVVSATGEGADGINIGGADATIINTGTISATGYEAFGIYSGGASATITNSGTIISEQYDAIRFEKSNATLNLLAGSVIQAGITFIGTGNTVSFGPGLNAMLSFSDLPETILTGDNLYAVSGASIAVLDRGGFALTDDMALTLAGDIAGVVDRGGRGQCLAGPNGQTTTGDAERCAAEAWLAGFGSFGGRPDSSSLAGFGYLGGGGLAGLEFMPGGDVSGGIFVGAMAAHGMVGESQDTTQTGGVMGGHAGFAHDGYFADFYAALGVLQIDSQRTVADNTVIGGLSLASASYAGYFLSPAVTIGTDLETGAGILTPSLRLRYAGLMLDGYSESGAADALVIDDRAVHELELRAQLALALTPAVSEAGTLSAVLRAGAEVFRRQADITGTLLGQTIAFTSGGEGTGYRGFAGLDLDVALSGGTSLFSKVELGLDSTGGYSASAHAGIGGAF